LQNDAYRGTVKKMRIYNAQKSGLKAEIKQQPVVGSIPSTGCKKVTVSKMTLSAVLLGISYT